MRRKYRVMCHPDEAGGVMFYTIETSRWGFFWSPFSLATYSSQWEAMRVAQRLAYGPPSPYAVAYFPSATKGPS